MAEGLRFVYVGNVPGHPGNHTYCPGCKKMLIQRLDMVMLENRLTGAPVPTASGRSPACGHEPHAYFFLRLA